MKTVDSESTSAVSAALESGGLAAITTTGRKTGQKRRIEISFSNFDGNIYVSGRPGKRGWYANLLADPRMTFHVTRGVRADLPAKATPITDPDERGKLLFRMLTESWGADPERAKARLHEWVDGSPLVKVDLVES